MAPTSASAADSPAQSAPDTIENNLQPFFVLHKASSRKSEKRSAGTGKTRRRIDLSPSPTKKTEKSEECDEQHRFEQLRMEAFELVWSKIDSTIKDVLRGINTNVFDEIHRWVCESFYTIKSFGTPGIAEATRAFPIVTDASSKLLFAGLVLTKNMEFVDDLLTFEEVGLCLKSHGCHVANLSSLDFSAKNGIGGCLRGLLRQFLMATLDAADMSILASWYREQENNNSPVVVIIDDMERCCGSVLSEFILMLSEWVVKIPIILLMGVSTTLDAPRNLLPSNVLQQLCPSKFVLGSPAERMDAVVEAVLVKQCSGFSVGHKVAVFLRNYFLNQDGTLISFIRALKIACALHFSMEPQSFILGGLLDEEEQEGEKSGLLPEIILKNAPQLPLYVRSFNRNQMAEQNGKSLVHGLSELKGLHKCWSIVVLCLYEAGNCNKIRLLDLLCEALDPDLYTSKASNNVVLENDCGLPITSDRFMRQKYSTSQKGGLISQIIRKVRDLPAATLYQLLKNWEKITMDVPEIHDKVKELQSEFRFEDGKLKQNVDDISKRHSSLSPINSEKDSKAISEKAAALLDSLVGDFFRPIECIPFHETVCFKSVEKLQSALIGDPRRRIQVDLLEFYKILRCSCCSKSGNILVPSMHDTSVMYTLAQEHGDLINLHDWFQSFKTIVLRPSKKGKPKSKQSPLPKKRKDMNESENKSEASIQARFCRAVTELQISGLLRMPSRRRPDCVQRVAFGL
ncbi:origin of replication complex subunit 3 isoform X1 [Quercus robur]|uniref:origin of replication complex subunit 3 isoform X1 n=2 Tax=Quercus robur TaxID=38942 RepID=UPI0021638DDC|nr:origin of replication complex subunit 3 isoform X1 [Quercus robur]